MKKFMVLSVISFTLTACGGSSNSSSKDTEKSPVNNTTNSSQPTSNTVIAKYSDFTDFRLSPSDKKNNFLERTDFEFNASASKLTTYTIFGKIDNTEVVDEIYAPNFYYSGKQFDKNTKVTYQDGTEPQIKTTYLDPISQKSIVITMTHTKNDISGKNPADKGKAFENNLFFNVDDLREARVNFTFPKQSECLGIKSSLISSTHYSFERYTQYRSLNEWQSNLVLPESATISDIKVGSNNEYTLREINTNSSSSNRYGILKDGKVIELYRNDKGQEELEHRVCHIYNTVAADAIANALKAKFEYKQ